MPTRKVDRKEEVAGYIAESLRTYSDMIEASSGENSHERQIRREAQELAEFGEALLESEDEANLDRPQSELYAGTLILEENPEEWAMMDRQSLYEKVAKATAQHENNLDMIEPVEASAYEDLEEELIRYHEVKDMEEEVPMEEKEGAYRLDKTSL